MGRSRGWVAAGLAPPPSHARDMRRATALQLDEVRSGREGTFVTEIRDICVGQGDVPVLARATSLWSTLGGIAFDENMNFMLPSFYIKPNSPSPSAKILKPLVKKTGEKLRGFASHLAETSVSQPSQHQKGFFVGPKSHSISVPSVSEFDKLMNALKSLQRYLPHAGVCRGLFFSSLSLRSLLDMEGTN